MKFSFRNVATIAVTAVFAGAGLLAVADATAVKARADTNYVSISLEGKKVLAPPQFNLAQVGKIASTGKNYEITLANGDKCTIGDKSNLTTFRPTIELSRYWYDSYKTLKLALPTTRTGTVSVSNNILTWDSGRNNIPNVRVYYLEPDPAKGQNEYGGIEYEIILKAPPITNAISLSLPDLFGMEWYYQPPLAEEWTIGKDEIISVNETYAYRKDGGYFHRPENVIGSYVICDSNSPQIYSTEGEANVKKDGTVFSLYRPLCTDAKGNKVWASFNRDAKQSGYLSITINQDWLNTATYPVVIDPNFGYETAGTSDATLSNGMVGCRRDSDASGTGVSITAKVRNTQEVSACKFGLYTNASPAVFVTNGGTAELTGIQAAAWYTRDFAVGPVITDQVYNIVAWGNGYTQIYYKSATGYIWAQASATYNGWPATISSWTTYNNYGVSIYCTYTAAASYDISNSPSSKAFGVVAASSTYYAKGSAPSNPVQDSECTFTITNNGSICDIDVHGHAFTGGVGWTLTSGAPGSNTVRLTVYYSGQNPASGIVVTTSDQEFYDGLASSSTIKFDFKFETGTFTDGVAKSTTLTFTAVAPD